MKILITGATAGIGAALARAAFQKKHELILTGRRRDRLEALAKELPGAKIAAFDVQSKTEVEKFLKDFEADLNGLDVLVNNAGLAKRNDPAHKAQLQDWETMIQTNVLGLLYMTRGILPKFVARKSGHVVNVGSVAGRWVYPGGAVYCATKAAVGSITEGLRMDLLGQNIRVSNIEPGMVETEFSEVRFEDKEKAKSVYTGMKALTAEDIAETILWVLDRPGHVNIQELVIYPTDQAAVGQVHRRS